MARRPDDLLAKRGGGVELLRFPALVFGFVAGMRTRLYDRGWLPSAKLDTPVISVGNITAGGTGKTPMVVWLVRELLERGLHPGVLSRGYGAAKDAKEGENDEARMFARLLPEVPRVQNPDRIEGGRRMQELGCDVIVLDDGFQHRRLRRDLDLVLLDATRPWGLPAPAPGAEPVRALLPRGLLREAPGALSRADALVLTRADHVDSEVREGLLRELQSLAPGKPVLVAQHRPCRLTAPDGEGMLPSALHGREVDLVSALGNPGAFEQTVLALGGRVREHRSFPDHHHYSREDLAGLGPDAENPERWLVTTAKDAVKLEAAQAPVHVLEVEFWIEEGAGVLGALLDALPPGRERLQRQNLHEGLHG